MSPGLSASESSEIDADSDAGLPGEARRADGARLEGERLALRRSSRCTRIAPLASPKSSLTSAASGIRPVGCAQHAVVRRRDERDRRARCRRPARRRRCAGARRRRSRIATGAVADARCGSPSDRRVVAARIVSVSGDRDDASAVAAPAQREPTADERANVGRLVDRRRCARRCTRAARVGDERRQAGCRASLRRCAPRSSESPACGERTRATAPPAAAARRRSPPRARAPARERAQRARRAARADGQLSVGAGTKRSSPRFDGRHERVLERRKLFLDPQRDAHRPTARRGRASTSATRRRDRRGDGDARAARSARRARAGRRRRRSPRRRERERRRRRPTRARAARRPRRASRAPRGVWRTRSCGRRLRATNGRARRSAAARRARAATASSATTSVARSRSVARRRRAIRRRRATRAALGSIGATIARAAARREQRLARSARNGARSVRSLAVVEQHADVANAAVADRVLDRRGLAVRPARDRWPVEHPEPRKARDERRVARRRRRRSRRSSRGAATTRRRRDAGQWTSTCPRPRAHAESLARQRVRAPVARSRSTPTTPIERRARGDGVVRDRARLDARRGVASADAARTGTRRIRPGHAARMRAVASSISSRANGDTSTSSTESASGATRARRRASRRRAPPTAIRAPATRVVSSGAIVDARVAALSNATSDVARRAPSARTLSRTSAMFATARDRSTTNDARDAPAVARTSARRPRRRSRRAPPTRSSSSSRSLSANERVRAWIGRSRNEARRRQRFGERTAARDEVQRDGDDRRDAGDPERRRNQPAHRALPRRPSDARRCGARRAPPARRSRPRCTPRPPRATRAPFRARHSANARSYPARVASASKRCSAGCSGSAASIGRRGGSISSRATTCTRCTSPPRDDVHARRAQQLVGVAEQVGDDRDARRAKRARPIGASGASPSGSACVDDARDLGDDAASRARRQHAHASDRLVHRDADRIAVGVRDGGESDRDLLRAPPLRRASRRETPSTPTRRARSSSAEPRDRWRGGCTRDRCARAAASRCGADRRPADRGDTR